MNSLSILPSNKSIAGYHLGHLLKDLEKAKEIAFNTLNELFRLYCEGSIKPQIDNIYPFSKVAEAMQRMHSRQNIGKILLRPDDNID